MEHFHSAQQNLSPLHKIGWRPAEKNCPFFFNTSVLDLDFYASLPIRLFPSVRALGKTESSSQVKVRTKTDGEEQQKKSAS
jgi:hypothetical protein